MGWVMGSEVSPSPRGVTVLAVRSEGVMALAWWECQHDGLGGLGSTLPGRDARVRLG